MSVRARLVLTAAGLMASTTPLSAHHSHGNYLRSQWVHLEGTVRQIHWMNPHSWIYLEVINEAGEPAIWALEGASVVTLRRNGWAPESIKTGDELSVRCHALKDGSNGCLLGFIEIEPGVEKEFD